MKDSETPEGTIADRFPATVLSLLLGFTVLIPAVIFALGPVFLIWVTLETLGVDCESFFDAVVPASWLFATIVAALYSWLRWSPSGPRSASRLWFAAFYGAELVLVNSALFFDSLSSHKLCYGTDGQMTLGVIFTVPQTIGLLLLVGLVVDLSDRLQDRYAKQHNEP